jgi:2'-5' RNA ligase
VTRFFVALVPPQEIQDDANEVIQELADHFRTSTSKSPPHVTLQPPFEWPPDRLPELQAVLANFASAQSPTPVRLSGFAAFPPRVLYINVVKTPDLLSLQAALMQELEQHLEIVDPKSRQRPFAPHMTVASRNVTRQTFKQAWEHLRDRPVEFEFVGDRLTLLIHNGQHWLVHGEFPLSVSSP